MTSKPFIVVIGKGATHAFGIGHGGDPIDASEEDAVKPIRPTVAGLNYDPDTLPREVHVFILDTIPENLQELTTSGIEGQDNAKGLLWSVLHPMPEIIRLTDKGHLTEQEYSIEQEYSVEREHLYEDWRILKNPSLGQETLIEDHGLCIAGIIRSIAPHAKLHMIQVLNKQGVGTLQSLGSALEKLTDYFRGLSGDERRSEYIVNMSFQYDLPAPEDLASLLSQLQGNGSITAEAKEEFKKIKLDHGSIATMDEARKELKSLIEVYESIRGKLQEMVDTAEDLHISLELIAAAGNDVAEKISYPAYRTQVWGVGALGKTGPTIYSVKADTEGTRQVFAPGGDINPDEPNNIDGRILGLSSRNLFCRWWAGTSFAAAMYSGALAQYLSQHPRSTPEEDLVGQFLESQSFKKPADKENEYHLDVYLPWVNNAS